MLKKRSTILNMWTLLHWLSAVSSPSSGISRLASSTSGVSHGSLKSAVVLKSKDCLRRIGAVEQPPATATSASRIRSRCMAGLRPATRASALPDLGADPVDHLLALDPGARGIGKFFQPGGARRAADTLRRARRVLVTTGFVVDSGAAETDGPPGAAVLGRALRALGAEVRYVTDAVTAPVLSAALTVLDEAADFIAWPDGDDAARRLLASERSEEHTSELQSPCNLVCRLLLEK